MNTNDAISTLTAMLNTINGNITGFQGQADALTLAISQLQGTLATQLASVTDEQFATLPQAISLQGKVDDLTTQVGTLTDANTALQAQVATPADPAQPTDPATSVQATP